MEDVFTDFSVEELQEFLDADLLGVSADPEFKERLRRQLWELVQARRRQDGPEKPGSS